MSEDAFAAGHAKACAEIERLLKLRITEAGVRGVALLETEIHLVIVREVADLKGDR